MTMLDTKILDAISSIANSEPNDYNLILAYCKNFIKQVKATDANKFGQKYTNMYNFILNVSNQNETPNTLYLKAKELLNDTYSKVSK